MESYDVLKEAITAVGAKSVAADMSVSSSLVYKWCEPKEGEDAGGAVNPLDRLDRIYQLTGDTGPISWLCQRAGGFFVENPPPKQKSDGPLLPVTQRILREFSELLEAVAKSLENDGQVDAKEAEKIRREWEDLKGVAEGFVLACEKGRYGENG